MISKISVFQIPLGRTNKKTIHILVLKLLEASVMEFYCFHARK